MAAQVFTLFALLLLWATVIEGSPHLKCNSPKGEVSDVRVSNCNLVPCLLRKGGNVTIEVDFSPNVRVTSLKDRIKGVILGISLPFSSPHPDACQGKGLTCPLKKGQMYTYRSVMQVLRIYPRIRLIVEWALVDHDNTPIFCVKIPAMIQ